MKSQPVQPPGLSKGLRTFLALTAACTGAVVLIVEILGAKMLSPYVGTSHFVWTAQITITLAALSIGYIFGGRLGDRSTSLRPLYFCILWAAIYLAGTVWWCEPVAYFFLKYNLALGALFSSAALFFVPLTLLATVVPFLLRMLTSSVQSVGTQAGRLSAISTFGSVAGVLLIGYVLIPFFPNTIIMLMSAGALGLIVLIYFMVWEQKGSAPAVTLLLVGVVFGGLAQRIVDQRKLQTAHLLFQGNSNFGEMKVVDNNAGTRRFYLNDYLVQNTLDPRDNRSASLFTYMLHDLATAYTPEVRKVLCIGMGVGIVPMRFAREGKKVDVVEINPGVIVPAKAFFGLEPEKLNLMIGDGRYYIAKSKEKYDAIILDAFLGDSSPSHLLTQEAFAQMRQLLVDEGVLVINCFGENEEGKDYFLKAVNATLGTAFKTVKVHATGNGNVFFVASPKKGLQLLRGPKLDEVNAGVREGVRSAFSSFLTISTNHAPVLKDAFNPVEFYDAANREKVRRTLAFSIREL